MYTLTPTRIGTAHGWELTKDGRFFSCHATFSDDFDRDIEMAADWAETLIGRGRLDWHHVVTDYRRRIEHWEAGR